MHSARAHLCHVLCLFLSSFFSWLYRVLRGIVAAVFACRGVRRTCRYLCIGCSAQHVVGVEEALRNGKETKQSWLRNKETTALP